VLLFVLNFGDFFVHLRPYLTFMKNKRRRKGGSDSDLSDREMTPSGSGIDEDTLQLLQVIFKLLQLAVAVLTCMITNCGRMLQVCESYSAIGLL